jgi:hypothetical protein
LTPQENKLLEDLKNHSEKMGKLFMKEAQEQIKFYERIIQSFLDRHSV